uniref:Uncharacterized protein n=1 Tax=Anguilla anguilla TaxID=7936 RepID=A0A0E9VTK2_ANGAN
MHVKQVHVCSNFLKQFPVDFIFT